MVFPHPRGLWHPSAIRHNRDGHRLLQATAVANMDYWSLNPDSGAGPRRRAAGLALARPCSQPCAPRAETWFLRAHAQAARGGGGVPCCATWSGSRSEAKEPGGSRAPGPGEPCGDGCTGGRGPDPPNRSRPQAGWAPRWAASQPPCKGPKLAGCGPAHTSLPEPGAPSHPLAKLPSEPRQCPQSGLAPKDGAGPHPGLQTPPSALCVPEGAVAQCPLTPSAGQTAEVLCIRPWGTRRPRGPPPRVCRTAPVPRPSSAEGLRGRGPSPASQEMLPGKPS